VQPKASTDPQSAILPQPLHLLDAQLVQRGGVVEEQLVDDPPLPVDQRHGHGHDRLGRRRPQAPGPGAPDRADGLDPLGGQRPDPTVDLGRDRHRVERVARVVTALSITDLTEWAAGYRVGQREEVNMRRVQVFDVNETLLDLSAMDPHFQRIFGDAGVRVTWFSQMIQSALVATVTGAYYRFGDHAMAALEMTAEQAGVKLAGDDKQVVGAQLRRLPAHPEVADALRRLGDAGLRLAALTNSTVEVARAQLTHAGLIDRFELVLSADTVRRLKPAPEPYQMAAERLGVAVDQVRLIAAHAWDVAGAARAGCATAFVARPGKVLDRLVERPAIIGEDLAEVADAILAVEREDGGRA
jgi:2-haloacid dehalogenase